MEFRQENQNNHVNYQISAQNVLNYNIFANKSKDRPESYLKTR